MTTRPLWVDRILMEPSLKVEFYEYFNKRREAMQQSVLDAVRRGNFHDAALATGRVEGMDTLFMEVKKWEREETNNARNIQEEGG